MKPYQLPHTLFERAFKVHHRGLFHYFLTGFTNGCRCNAMLRVVSYLDIAPAVGFIHRYLHRGCNFIGIHNYPAPVVPCSTANSLDQ